MGQDTFYHRAAFIHGELTLIVHSDEAQIISIIQDTLRTRSGIGSEHGTDSQAQEQQTTDVARRTGDESPHGM